MLDSSEIKTEKRVIHPNSLANLKPVRAGEPAPKGAGRPKTKLFKEAALEWLREDPQRRVDIIERLAVDKPDFLVQLVDGKLMDTSVSLNLSVSDQSKLLASQIARLLINGNNPQSLPSDEIKTL